MENSVVKCLILPLVLAAYLGGCGSGEDSVETINIAGTTVDTNKQTEVQGKKGWPLNGRVINNSSSCVTVWYADRDDGSDSTCWIMAPHESSDPINDDIDFIQSPRTGTWQKIFNDTITIYDYFPFFWMRLGIAIPMTPTSCRITIHSAGC